MGTPHFAVPSLNILVENGYDIVGVITAPDRPAGRGQKLRFSPVKEYALKKELHILQPTNLKNKDFLAELESLQADLQVVVAFRMLPALVFEMPPKGCINLHGSLLPQYRGAAPINWAVINGETETGVTTFFIEQKIDTGELIYQEKIPIHKTDTAGDLHDRMMQIGANVILKTVQGIEDGTAPRTPQVLPEGDIKKAPKIYKSTCEINWDQSAETIYNHIRGLSPYPAAYTTLHNKKLKLFATNIVEEQEKYLAPGEIHTDGKNWLHIGTCDQALSILDLQLESKKRMPITDFLRGYKIESGTLLNHPII